MSAHTPGQAAYEAACRQYPTYHDGVKRRTWDQLDHVSKAHWERQASLATPNPELKEEA